MLISELDTPAVLIDLQRLETHLNVALVELVSALEKPFVSGLLDLDEIGNWHRIAMLAIITHCRHTHRSPLGNDLLRLFCQNVLE